MIVAGIDSGSRALKVVLLEAETNRPLASACRPQMMRRADLADEVLSESLASCGMPREYVAGVVATGYGRHRVAFADDAITEITCHARGVRHLVPGVRSIIEIGGQDSKVIRLAPTGKVRDFVMNDRCAAGTGRFLEMVADLLNLSLEEMGDAARASSSSAQISSTCAVFAESEILGLLTSGVGVEDIAAGVQDAVASRVTAMTEGGLDEPTVLTGGVAEIPGMLQAMSRRLGHPIVQARSPQFTGALGAALFAADELVTSR